MPAVTIREIAPNDYPRLEEFLYLAVHQRDPSDPIPRSVVDEPGVRNYIDGFGERRDDFGVIAQAEGHVVGAAWARVLNGEPRGYGYIDDLTPELAISVLPNYRNQGIGARLLLDLINRLTIAGYAKTSLSVDKDNPASRLYARLGFKTVAEKDEDLIMVRALAPHDHGCI